MAVEAALVFFFFRPTEFNRSLGKRTGYVSVRQSVAVAQMPLSRGTL